MTYTTIYRIGGPARFEWRKCPATARSEADNRKRACERMGYKALVFRTDQLEAVGMPTGWEA